MTVKELYDNKTKWFEPEGDNYIPLKSVEPILTSEDYNGVLHTSFDEIVEWSIKENRYSGSFASGMPGDWKKSSTGGRGFLLSEVDGKPYWTDALGQIPFAIDTYEYYLRNGSGVPDFKTVRAGVNFANGLPYVSPDNTKSYDNMMIIKTTEWAKKHMGGFNSKNNNFGWYTRSLNLYSDELSNPATANQVKKYKEIIK